MGLSSSRISERNQKINNKIRRANNNQQSLIICALHDVCVVQYPEFSIRLKVTFELSTAACREGLIYPELFNRSAIRSDAARVGCAVKNTINILFIEYKADETMTVKKSF